MNQDMYDKGLSIRRKVLGDAYVDAALKNADDFNRPLQELVTEYCWGYVWGREGLPLKQRAMLNLAMIAILNRPHELKAHSKGASPRTRSWKCSCRSRSMPACPARWIRSGSPVKCSRRRKRHDAARRATWLTS